eukprot:Lithocolla_globosa_v1_NODE_8804_length_780_cov_23.772414.p1 type:complete len:183 gc:universal NODE_8804_length_780_cov_23.772414:89-637(+)
MPKAFHSAVVISPPQSQWSGIQSIRQKHDKAFHRWPPHINMLWPFSEPSDYATTVPQLTQALASFPPFTLRFDTFKTFQSKKSSVVWLSPSTADQNVHALQRVMQVAFPQYDDVSKKSEDGFSPHLTVGQWPNKDVPSALAKLNGSFEPVEWEVKEVYVISREGVDGAFEVKHVVPLGGSNP